MNDSQRLWWEQARSDHKVFLMLSSQGAVQCHLLHYLQMATEKLAKAYFWRSGHAPPKNHAGFVPFLRFLGQIRVGDQACVAGLFSFARFEDFRKWIYAVLPMAYALERLAPALANDGANPEYSWPHAQPATAPANHEFPEWASLTARQGRELMRVIQIAVERFADYADS